MRRFDLRGLVRSAAKIALLGLLTTAVSLLAIEIVYRLQPVDTYRGELREYNPAPDLDASDSRPTVLFMGDSLTAGLRSYPSIVREARPDLRVINAGIPGSGILQANLVASRRFARFTPSVFVYQINVGNDLLNLRYPVSWRRLSVRRNLYWTVVHRARSVEYLNYKLGQFVRSVQYARTVRGLEATGKSIEDVTDTGCTYGFDDFDPMDYTPRSRTYVKAEPALFEEQVLVRGERERDFERLLAGLSRLMPLCEPPSCSSYLLVIPHASQVSPEYLETMRSLGARFERPEQVLADEYPFLTRIREFLTQNDLGHVKVLDPAPALRSIEREGRRTYYLYDPHLNACGQAALADVVLSQALSD